MCDNDYDQYVELDEPITIPIINYTYDIESTIQIKVPTTIENKGASAPTLLLKMISNIFGLLLPFQS